MSTDSERRLYHVKESVQFRPLVEGGDEFAYVQTAALNLARLASLAQLCRDLAAVNAEPILLPGASLLRLYSDVGCRSMEDMDLLIRADRRAQVADTLAAQGWRSPPRHPDLFVRADGFTLDLHTDLLNGERLTHRRGAGWIEPGDAWARCCRREVAGFEFLTLAEGDEILVTVAHALRHSYRRLTWLVDFVLQLRATHLSAEELWVQARAVQLHHSLAYALELVDESRVSLPSWIAGWSEEYSVNRRVGSILRWIHRHRHETVGGELLGCWTGTRGLDRLRLLSEFVFPRQDVLLQVYPRLPSTLAPLVYPLRLLQIVGRSVSELTHVARWR